MQHELQQVTTLGVSEVLPLACSFAGIYPIITKLFYFWSRDQKIFSLVIIGLNSSMINNMKPEKQKEYRILVDEENIAFDHSKVTGQEILEKAGKTPVECHTLYLKGKHNEQRKIGLTEEVDLSLPGIERFTVGPPEVFSFMVDDEPFTTTEQELTPNQILELAGFTPVTDFYLMQTFADGSEPISYKETPEQTIHLECPPMTFVEMFRGATPVS
jgi:multiubiquitin